MPVRLFLCMIAACLTTGCALAVGAGAVVVGDEIVEDRQGGDGIF